MTARVFTVLFTGTAIDSATSAVPDIAAPLIPRLPRPLASILLDLPQVGPRGIPAPRLDKGQGHHSANSNVSLISSFHLAFFSGTWSRATTVGFTAGSSGNGVLACLTIGSHGAARRAGPPPSPQQPNR